MRPHPRRAVLVAEDHPVNQKVVSLLLSGLGVEADIVSDGSEAIAATQGDGYSLIFMDIMMPEVDGFEAAYQIRKLEFKRGRHTPIIACTALDADDIMDRCIRSGIDAHLAKPLSIEAVQDIIETWSDLPIRAQPVSENFRCRAKRIQLQPGDDQLPISETDLKLLYGLEKLDDILVLFLSVTETLLAQLQSALKFHDAEKVRRLAHEIKGSSYAVAAHEMVTLCKRLEKEGEDEDWPEADRTYATLGLAFARVRSFLAGKRRKQAS